MTLRLPIATPAVVLATALVVAPSVQLHAHEGLSATARSTQAPALRLAQKQDDANPDEGRKGRRGPSDADGKSSPRREGNPQRKGAEKGQDGGRNGTDTPRKPVDQAKQKQDADKARQDALQQRQLQIEQAKQKALKQKQDADKARQDALQQRQQQIEQTKQKALKQKQDADKARQDAAKKKQPVAVPAQPAAPNRKEYLENARQEYLKQQKLKAEQAKEKALKQKQDADKARQDALQQRQQQIEQTKQKALKQKQDADKARQDAMQKKAREAVPAKKDAGPQRFDRTRADREFERARDQARRPKGPEDGQGGRPGDSERWRDDSARKFEELRKGRKERDQGSRRVIVEPDKRVIVRQNDRAFIRHDESSRLQRVGREVRRERRKDGTLMIVTMGLAGALIYSLQDDDGRLLRRSRKDRNGREVVLIDNHHAYRDRTASRFGPERYYDSYVDLPPPVVRIPRDQYIVDYERATPDAIYDALSAPPIERLERGYSLDEIRHSYPVLERMRRVDLDTVNFAFGAWDVEEAQYPKLERIAEAMRRVLDRSPDEVFLIEGHTDAVGSEIDNLSLSDRRAETVAIILTDEFGVPPENLTTQGYGEQYLKVLTEEPSRINRRVSVRRITPLLSREGWDER